MIIVLAMMAALLRPPQAIEPTAAFGIFMTSRVTATIFLTAEDGTTLLTAEDGVTLLTAN